MANGKIKARWVGPGEVSLPDGTHLVPGETVYEISEGEARESDNWQPVVAEKPKPTVLGGDS